MAVEAVTSDYDGFTYNDNNSYLYNNPVTKKFILFPHGADQAFWCPFPGQEINRLEDTFQIAEDGQTGKKARAVPELDRKFRAEVARIGSAPIWDVNFMLGRVAHLEKLLAAAPRTGLAAKDIASFQKYRPILEAFIKAGGTSKGVGSLPTGP